MMMKKTKRKSSVRYTTEEESEIFKIAVEHMNMHVFVYDIPLKKIYFFNSKTPPFGLLQNSEYSIEDLRACDIMDSENFNIFNNLLESIHNGDKSTDAIIKTKHPVKSTWNHIMLINYFNENGKPIRAIGTIQDVSSGVETEIRYIKEKQFRIAMMADSRRVYEINVTKDRFIKLETIQDSTDSGNWKLYTQSMTELCKTVVYKDDWEVFLKVATRENLIQGFQNGITEFYCEYRVVDDNGTIMWSSSSTHLLEDPISGDIKGFIYVKDIDEQKRQELELYRQAERDPLTGIYNRRTAEKLITQLLDVSEATQLHGFLTIDVDEFKVVNDTFGHLKGDVLLQQITEGVGKILRNVDILARMGGDEFLVFLYDISSESDIRSIATRLCDCVRNICIEEGNDYRSTISIGISIYPKDGKTFYELYKSSDNSLHDVKQHGKNNISFFCRPDMGGKK